MRRERSQASIKIPITSFTASYIIPTVTSLLLTHPVLAPMGAKEAFAVDINLEGTIAGFTIDNNNVQHGFIRSPWGAFTSFDAPGAGTAAGEGTMVTLESGLNVQGETIGWSGVAPSTSHRLVRAPKGVITL